MFKEFEEKEYNKAKEKLALYMWALNNHRYTGTIADRVENNTWNNFKIFSVRDVFDNLREIRRCEKINREFTQNKIKELQKTALAYAKAKNEESIENEEIELYEICYREMTGRDDYRDYYTTVSLGFIIGQEKANSFINEHNNKYKGLYMVKREVIK